MTRRSQTWEDMKEVLSEQRNWQMQKSPRASGARVNVGERPAWQQQEWEVEDPRGGRQRFASQGGIVSLSALPSKSDFRLVPCYLLCLTVQLGHLSPVPNLDPVPSGSALRT